MTSCLKPEGEHLVWVFYCLGCDTLHSIDFKWQFGQALDKPTISFSICKEDQCQVYIKDDRIQFRDRCFSSASIGLPNLN